MRVKVEPCRHFLQYQIQIQIHIHYLIHCRCHTRLRMCWKKMPPCKAHYILQYRWKITNTCHAAAHDLQRWIRASETLLFHPMWHPRGTKCRIRRDSMRCRPFPRQESKYQSWKSIDHPNGVLKRLLCECLYWSAISRAPRSTPATHTLLRPASIGTFKRPLGNKLEETHNPVLNFNNQSPCRIRYIVVNHSQHI